MGFFSCSSQIVGKMYCLYFLHGRKYLHLLLSFFFIILSIINRAKLLADSAFQRSKHKLSVLLWGFFMAKFWERGDRRIKITCFSVMGKNKNLFMKID